MAAFTSQVALVMYSTITGYQGTHFGFVAFLTAVLDFVSNFCGSVCIGVFVGLFTALVCVSKSLYSPSDIRYALILASLLIKIRYVPTKHTAYSHFFPFLRMP
jgi:branched-subunit amino acid ABC-type transport system permease component